MVTDNRTHELSPPGDLIDVNGRKVHIQRHGKGSPIVVFESGIYADSFAFSKVQPEIAKITTAISYDRAGMGYSELSSEPKRTSPVIASELFELLEALGINDPLILAGWSAGGIYIREFYRQHPEMVAGLVLIDSVHENQDNRLPEEFKSQLEKNRNAALEFFTKSSKLTHEEILKELGDPPFWQNYPQHVHKYFIDLSRPELFEYLIRIYSFFFSNELTQGDLTPKSLGNLPLVVLFQTSEDETLSESENKIASEVDTELARELAGLSTESQLIKVDCGHHIALEKPEVVIEAIEKVVEKVRKKT